MTATRQRPPGRRDFGSFAPRWLRQVWVVMGALASLQAWARPVRTEPHPLTIAVSLEQLDAFLIHARATPALAERLQGPLPLEDLLALAAAEGFAVEEADVIAAQLREEEGLSDAELQRRAAQEARRLRTFIPG
ncbi:MAG: hypothetical protein RLZZ124_895 [Cyanobacteriota bacterium]